MPAFTLGRIAKLYGLHRSTVYEAVAKGRVSAGLDRNGQRVVELAEAIRVWGEPPGRPTPKPDTRHPAEQAHPTPLPDSLGPLLEELRLLREEVAGLRAELRLLEHRPQHPPPVEERRPAKAGNPALEEKKFERTEGEQPKPAKSFADLLKALPE